MAIADRLSTLDDASLATLRANAVRLQDVAGDKRAAAVELMPLIDAELAAREGLKPPKPARAAAPVRKKKVVVE